MSTKCPQLKSGTVVQLPDRKYGTIAYNGAYGRDVVFWDESLQKWCVFVWSAGPHQWEPPWNAWVVMPIEDIKPVKDANRAPLIQKPDKPRDNHDGYEPWWTTY